MTDYSRELNKGMKVFSQLYVGLKDQSAGQPHLGFATPLEKGSVFTKRQETIHNWLGGLRHVVIENGMYKRDSNGDYVYVENKLNTKVVENTPRAGFKITDDVKRIYWGGGNVVWRVCDPEGFELEIQSQNLMAIIQVAGIGEGGLIPGNCIWGRSGKDNILLHEGSEEFKNAILSAETLKKPKEVGSRDRVIGVDYLLQDGSTGIYLGKFWVTTEKDTITEYMGTTTIANRHIRVKEEHSSVNSTDQFDAVLFGKTETPEQGYVTFYKKAPLVRPVKDAESPMTSKQAQEIVDVCDHWSFASPSKKDRIVHVSLEKFEKFKYVPKLVSRKDFSKKMKEFQRYIGHSFRDGTTVDAGELHFFYDYAFSKKTGIKIGQDVYSGYCAASRGHYPTRVNDWGDDTLSMGSVGAVKFEDGMKRYFSGKYGYNDYAMSQPDAKKFESFPLPKFPNKAELLAWCESLYSDGRYVEFVVEPDFS